MAITIRTARDEDETALLAIDRSAWSSAVSPTPPPSEDDTFFTPGRTTDAVLVAEAEDGSVAGYVLLEREPWLPSSEHVFALRGLAVSPGHQRRGVGRTLVDAALAEAERRGARRVKSRVLGTNPASLALHAACGFQVEGRLHREFHLDGVDVDDVLLAWCPDRPAAPSGWATARITHVAERTAWEAAQADGEYVAPSLADEGFIHCSTPWQVGHVARARFAGRDDLVLLVVDPDRLRARVVFENCEGGIEPFPHVYGPIAADAVVEVVDLAWDDAASAFRLPPAFVPR